MGKVNGCLKCIFIFFNVLFAILGVVLIVWAVQASFHSDQMSTVGNPNVAWTWLLALAVLGTSCLGIFAGCSEKPLVLKIFAGFMGVGIIVMLFFGVIMAIGRNELIKELKTDPAKVVEVFMEEPDVREQLDELQKESSCCGFHSPSDWGDEIPVSCACLTMGPECQAKPRGSKGPEKVYREPCTDILSLLNYYGGIFMGLFFGLAVTALIGLLISLLMIHQVKRYDNAETSISMKGY